MNPKILLQRENEIFKEVDKYLEIFNEIRTELLPVTFLSASPQFKDIMSEVLANVDTESSGYDEEVESNISRDLLSYITIGGIK